MPGRVKGFYKKEGVTHPITSRQPYGTYAKGTANIGIPKKFERQKLALQKAEKLKEEQKVKNQTTAKDGKETKVAERAEVQKTNEAQKPATVQPKNPNAPDPKSVLSDAWFDAKISAKPQPKPAPSTQQPQQTQQEQPKPQVQQPQQAQKAVTKV